MATEPSPAPGTPVPIGTRSAVTRPSRGRMVGVTDVLAGDIWLARPDPVSGYEQAGRRPVAVVSPNGLHSLPIN